MLFFLRTLDAVPEAPGLPPQLRISWWRPRDRLWPPAVLPQSVNRTWSLLHHVGAFANPDFGVLTLLEGETLVHRSGVFPGFFRFPFMRPDDLQIGDTWTAEPARGRGLAGLAIREVLRATGRPGRRYWYLVEEGNAASIRVIEKMGFHLVGSGAKLPRFGSSALGFYALTSAAAGRLSDSTPL
jgi:RimJ/RimL family protein N-acetyltransferase